MGDYTCRTDAIGRKIYYYRQRRIAASDVPRDVLEQLVCVQERRPTTYLADLPRDLREELANYIPYTEIPYPLEPRYWERRGKLFGAETPSKSAYSKAYQTAGKCTYGEELRQNLRGCFLEAMRTRDLERARKLAIQAFNMQIPIVDESTDITGWSPTILGIALFSPGTLEVLSKLPYYEYNTIAGRVIRDMEQDPTIADRLRDAMFGARVQAIVEDKTGKLMRPVYIPQVRTRSMKKVPRDRMQEIRNSIDELVGILRPSPEIVEGLTLEVEELED